MKPLKKKRMKDVWENFSGGNFDSMAVREFMEEKRRWDAVSVRKPPGGIPAWLDITESS